MERICLSIASQAAVISWQPVQVHLNIVRVELRRFLGTASSKSDSSSSRPSSRVAGLDSESGGEGVAERWAGEREDDEDEEDEKEPSAQVHTPEDTEDPGDIESPITPSGRTGERGEQDSFINTMAAAHSSIWSSSVRELRRFRDPWKPLVGAGTSMVCEGLRSLRSVDMSASLAKSVSWSASRADFLDSNKRMSSILFLTSCLTPVSGFVTEMSTSSMLGR